jgi:cytosine/adenosine deaminase-related metal-dependent hydrolase
MIKLLLYCIAPVRPFGSPEDGLVRYSATLGSVNRSYADRPKELRSTACGTRTVEIAGAADRLGTLEKGKIANAIVTTGDLFAEKTTIRHVFIDGRPVFIEESEGGDRRRGRSVHGRQN